MVLASCQGNKCYSQTTRNFSAMLESTNRRTMCNQPSEHRRIIHLQGSNNSSQLVRCEVGEEALSRRGSHRSCSFWAIHTTHKPPPHRTQHTNLLLPPTFLCPFHLGTLICVEQLENLSGVPSTPTQLLQSRALEEAHKLCRTGPSLMLLSWMPSGIPDV